MSKEIEAQILFINYDDISERIVKLGANDKFFNLHPTLHYYLPSL
jgi:tRNA splicing ligase